MDLAELTDAELEAEVMLRMGFCFVFEFVVRCGGCMCTLCAVVVGNFFGALIPAVEMVETGLGMKWASMRVWPVMSGMSRLRLEGGVGDGFAVGSEAGSCGYNFLAVVLLISLDFRLASVMPDDVDGTLS